MAQEYEDYCAVCPVSCPHHDHASRTCVAFCLSFHVSFVYPPAGSTEEEELNIDDLVETEPEDRSFEVGRENLINDDEEMSKSTIQGFLSSMNVPERPFMVDEILACARSMVNDKTYANNKFLCMNIIISVVQEEEEFDADDDTETAPGPASESSIQELEIVRVEEQSASTPEEQCGICLEEFSWSLEARRMPCSHIFHGDCIVNWLHIRNFCPLCRFELN